MHEFDEQATRERLTSQPQFPTGEWDAYDWADAFLVITKDNPAILTDRDTLMGWFANAIMTGYDHARAQSPLAK